MYINTILEEYSFKLFDFCKNLYNLLNVRERESLESNVVKVLAKNDVVDISKRGKEFYKTNDGYYIKKEFLTKYNNIQ